jgi:hypothetical protein
MTEKDAAKRPVAAEKEAIRHARLELPDADHGRLTAAAKSRGLGVAASIRRAVRRPIRKDEQERVISARGTHHDQHGS